MRKLLKNSRKKIGQLPGSLIYMGEDRKQDIIITLSRYNKEMYEEKKIKFPEENVPEPDENHITWINVDGIHDTALVGRLGEMFNIHSLTLEDILNTGHRPKTEDNGDYLFVVLKFLDCDSKGDEIKSEQVSLIINNQMIISFQEDKVDDFEAIRETLRKNKGKIRELGADYLAYRLLDTVVDKYFTVVENIGDRIIELEDELLESPTKLTLQKLYKLKSDMIIIRRAVWPLREVISGLEKIDSDIIRNTTQPYLRDLYDHVVQLIDTNENYREMVSGMMDIYLSSVSNKLNEIMKVLTIISTFFIPLNFLAGLYGMNFNTEASPLNMPELNWRFGYPMIIAVMLSVSGGLFIFFKKKGWF
ncbi:MAG: magnesium/cobalt transporter CorA [Ignavibacteria bacterium]